jgi:hypothetical protein
MHPVPISERRLAANRANARKSTGPRTPEGKRRVAQNACRHRLYAQQHTLPPRYQAFLLDRAQRNTAAIQDPVLRALQYEFFLASGYEELLWAHQDSLHNYWLAQCQGDEYEANLNYFTDETNLEALHRFHAHHARRMDAILKALLRYSRFAAKRQGVPCDNPQALAEALIQAALRRTRQPNLTPPDPGPAAPAQEQSQPLPAPAPAPRLAKVIPITAIPAYRAPQCNRTQSNPTPPRRGRVLSIRAAHAPPRLRLAA